MTELRLEQPDAADEQAPSSVISPESLGGALAFLLLIAFSPALYASFWSPRAALLLVVGGLGLPLLLWDAWRRDGAAIAGAVFLAIAALSALLARNSTIAVFGLYGWGTGLLYYVILMSAWSGGRRLTSEVARQRLTAGIVAGALVNSFVAVLQTVVDLDAWSISGTGDRAHGLMGNPVHLAALVSAALALIAWKSVAEKGVGLAPAVAAVLLAAAAQASGSRFALIAVALVALGVITVGRLRAAALVLAIVLGLAGGALLPSVASSDGMMPTSGTARVTADPGGGFVRLEYWKSALAAFRERPVIGYGPGDFRSAASPHRTVEQVEADGEDRLVADAHNIVVELLVVTGALGLLAFLTWGLLAGRRVRGTPLLAFAAVTFAFSLVQPLNLTTVPIAFLALGAIGSGPPALERPRAVGFGQALLAVLALIMAALLLVGDYFRKEAVLDFVLADARTSEKVLPHWPEPAEMLARALTFHAVGPEPDDEELLSRAIHWRLEAAERDRTNPHSWSVLAELEIYVGDLESARRHFLRALESDPLSVRALSGLGEVALRQGRERAAAEWYSRALELTQDGRHAEFLRSRLRILQVKSDA